MKYTSLSSFIFWTLLIFFFFLFSTLGIWQIYRLQWKNTLIARVNERIHLAPRPAPLLAEWFKIKAPNYDYLPVSIKGHFLNDKNIFVHALTIYGSGYWLLSPLETSEHSIIFINRGFVPMEKKKKIQNTFQEVRIHGLLRMEEKNGYLIRNNPDKDLWYTRELSAMAKAKKLSTVAPYFIDADKAMESFPIGGLTVIQFPNNHLVYALTGFTLAGGVLVGALFLLLPKKISKK
ncbi:MAG: surfeit locus 1 family protein [Candidatus Tokpelaia sp. JSC161]|jgi:surfeit locus 1 family protein|nr:MAG: surfeit locus 1 family protein [Candidatus Tokpelaia sp. JSC161]